MTDKEYKKCNEKGYCKWLLERCEPYNNSIKKGLAIMELYDTETNKMAGKIVGYKAHAKDRFLSLNFCPFCGFSFYDLREKGKRVGQ
jgi:hypothetical protein